MRFVSDRVRSEWYSSVLFSNQLRGIVEDASDFAYELWQWEFVVTCILRTPEENDALYGHHSDHLDGVHVHGRGLDVRTRNVDSDAIKGVAGYINSKYIYDPNRPLKCVCLIEEAGIGSSAPHMHFQNHPNTITRLWDGEEGT